MPPQINLNNLPDQTPKIDLSGLPDLSNLPDQPENEGFLSRAWRSISEPLWKGPAEKAQLSAQIKTDPNVLKSSPDWLKRWMGFNAGVEEGVGNLVSGFTSPLNIGLTALGLGSEGAAAKGLSGLAKTLGYGAKATSVPLIAHGAQQTFSPESTAAERIFGLMEAAGGGAVLGSPMPKVRTKPILPELVDEIPSETKLLGSGFKQESGFAPRGLLGPARTEPAFFGTETGQIAKAPDFTDFLNSVLAEEPSTTVSPFDMPARRLTGEIADLPLARETEGTYLFRGNQPAIRTQGDISFGETNPQQSLGYPLDVIPNRLRPRIAQTIEESLVGNRGEPRPSYPLPRTVQLGEGLEKPPSYKPLSLSEETLPSAPIKTRGEKLGLTEETTKKPSINEPLDIKPEGKSLLELASSVSKQTGDSPKVITDAVNSGNPIVSKLALDYAKEADRLGPFSFAGTRLKALGSAGIELYRKGARFTQQERFNLKDWAEPYRTAIMRLSRDEQAKFGNYVEGNLPIPNERVANAVEQWKIAAEKSGIAAEESGMMIELASGKKVPFKRIAERYWPHRLTEKDLANLPTKIDEMVAEGLSRQQANRIITNARKYGELILPQQHQRLGARFSYETHAKSGLIHLESMAKSVARTKEFGRYDLAKGGELGIRDLIESSSNPERAYDIMRRVIGRDETINKKLDSFVRSARTAVSWMRLQNYGLSSIVGNQLPNMLRANSREYIKSLGTFIGRNRAITDKSAAMINVSHGIFEQTRKFNPMKVYGGELAENIVRGQAAGIGEGLAKTYFTELKKNPNNFLAKKELFELILEDVNQVIKQNSLTAEQLRMAAGRNAEISQGLTSPLNLPMWMSKPVTDTGNAVIQLGLIFKKQATIQSKMIKDAWKKDPIKTTAILMGMSQVAGGVIGGVKSAAIGTVRGLISGEDIGEKIDKEYEQRANYVGRITGSENELLNRSIDRALQSWALGVGGDLLYLALDENAWSDLVAGPAVGALGDIFGNITNPTQLGRETLKMLPIPGAVGTGIQKEVLPTRSQK